MSDDIQRRVQLGQAINIATSIVSAQGAAEGFEGDAETLATIDALVPACLDLIERLQAASLAEANAQATVVGAFAGTTFTPAAAEPVWSAAPAAEAGDPFPPLRPIAAQYAAAPPAIPGASGGAGDKWSHYFANTSQYWDNRSGKAQKRAQGEPARGPDFKQKDEPKTALWIDGRDTPGWVKNAFAQAA